MQKKNKILRRIVSALLCLTLISSCLVSSIFAKYVKTATGNISSVGIKKFGVTVDMVVDEAKLKRVFGDDYISADDLKKLTAEEQKEAKANKVWLEVSTDAQKQAGVNTVTIHNLALKPGDDLTGKQTGDSIYDLVQFTIGGTANVDCRVIIDADFVYDYTEFVYDGTNKYMPFIFTSRVNETDGGCSSIYNLSLNNENVAPGWSLEYPWILNFPLYTAKGDMGGNTDRETMDNYAYKDFSAGDDIKFNYDGAEVKKVNFGVKWPFYKEYTDVNGKLENYDERDTIISQNPDAKLDLSYTVKVEQTDPNAT